MIQAQLGLDVRNFVHTLSCIHFYFFGWIRTVNYGLATLLSTWLNAFQLCWMNYGRIFGLHALISPWLIIRVCNLLDEFLKDLRLGWMNFVLAALIAPWLYELLCDTCRIINVWTGSNDWQTTAWMYFTLDYGHRQNEFYSMFASCTLKVKPNLIFVFDLREICSIMKIGTNANDW